MKQKVRLPKTDSIDELAQFWDTHDLTDFEDQLEVVTEPVFVTECEPAIGDTSLIGRAKELEVAGMLIRNGIYVFWPFVDTVADLPRRFTVHSCSGEVCREGIGLGLDKG
jgi:hypothetical protein